MNHVRNLMLICLAALIVAVGCISMTAPSGPATPGTETPNKTCHMATIQTPVTSEQCEDVTFTDQVCAKRKLNYTVSYAPRVDLCIGDGACVGKPVSACTSTCQNIMSRCIMTIENKDRAKSGTWIVGATFSIKNFGFIKEPITQSIGPGQKGAFDFYQIYTATDSVNTATCNLTITSEPIIDDCHDETRTKRTCQNVTTFKTSQQQVCQ